MSFENCAHHRGWMDDCDECLMEYHQAAIKKAQADLAYHTAAHAVLQKRFESASVMPADSNITSIHSPKHRAGHADKDC
jgi:hypothetical protein